MKRTQNKIATLGIGIMILGLQWSSPANASAALVSFKGLGKVLNAASKKPLVQPAVFQVEPGCDDPWKKIRVPTSILVDEYDLESGDINQLDDEGRTQCDVDGNKVSAGRIFYVRGEREIWMGSAEAVGNRKTIVSAVHIFTDSGVEADPEIFDKYNGKNGNGRFVFRLFEKINGNCQEVDYPITKGAFNTKNVDKNSGLDMAVFSLESSIPSDYLPTRIGTQEEVIRVLNGEDSIAIAGFANHASTGNGKVLSISTCFAQEDYYRTDPKHNNNRFIYSCDTFNGMSGGSIRTFDSKGAVLIGVHSGEAKGSKGKIWDPQKNYNFGSLVNDWLRETVSEFASEDSPLT